MAKKVRIRQAASGPFVEALAEVPGLSDVLGVSADAGGIPIEGVGAPTSQLDAVRLADLISVFSLIDVGRLLVSAPAGTGPQTLPLTAVSGFGVAANRVQLGGPAIVLMQWEAQVNLSQPCTFRVATTSDGPDTQGPVQLPSPVNFFFGASAFFVGADPDEELWLTTDSTAIPTITSGKMTVVKIPLS